MKCDVTPDGHDCVMSNDDIVNLLLPFVMNEMRMPAGFTITVIEEIERLREENAGLVASIPHIIAGVRAGVRAEIEREHAAAAPSAESVGDATGTDNLSVESGRDALCELVIDPRIDRLTKPLVQMGIDAIDRAVTDVERLRAQVVELLPWAEAAAHARVEAAVGDRHHDAMDLLARIDAGEFGT
jgi:hypothetical protein